MINMQAEIFRYRDDTCCQRNHKNLNCTKKLKSKWHSSKARACVRIKIFLEI